MRYKTTINIAWPTYQCDIYDYYQQRIKKCVEMKVNQVRIFFSQWGLSPFLNSEHLTILKRMLENFKESDIEVIIVLATYVDFNIQTSRDFVENKFSWNTYCFRDSFSMKPKSFFQAQIDGENPFVVAVEYVLSQIYVYDNVKTIELMNEIDLISTNKIILIAWINSLSSYLDDRFYTRYKYIVSLSNHKKLDYFTRKVLVDCDLHCYSFPSTSMLKNLERYLNMKNQVYFFEYSKHSDYHYIDKLDSIIYITAGLWGAFLLGYKNSPAIWWWDEIMESIIYRDIFDIFHSKSDIVYLAEIDRNISVEYIRLYNNKRNSNKILIRKIFDRLRGIVSNPKIILQELSAIGKFLSKIVCYSSNVNITHLAFSSADKVFILFEAYVSAKILISSDLISSSICWKKINLLTGDVTIGYSNTRDVLVDASEGVFLIELRRTDVAT